MKIVKLCNSKPSEIILKTKNVSLIERKTFGVVELKGKWGILQSFINKNIIYAFISLILLTSIYYIIAFDEIRNNVLSSLKEKKDIGAFDLLILYIQKGFNHNLTYSLINIFSTIITFLYFLKKKLNLS